MRTSPRVAAKQQKQQQEQQAEEQSRGGTLRQRFADDAGPEQREKDRFTPTPRRSIHSYKVTETTRQTLTKTADGRELARDYSYQKETYRDGVKTGQQDKRHLVLSLLPKICMLMVFLAAAYYTVKVSFIPLCSGDSLRDELTWAFLFVTVAACWKGLKPFFLRHSSASVSCVSKCPRMF